MFRQHFSARYLGFQQTTGLVLTYLASRAQTLNISSGERVNQSTAEPGVNYLAASVFLLILMQQQHMLFDSVPPSPVMSSPACGL